MRFFLPLPPFTRAWGVSTPSCPLFCHPSTDPRQNLTTYYLLIPHALTRNFACQYVRNWLNNSIRGDWIGLVTEMKIAIEYRCCAFMLFRGKTFRCQLLSLQSLFIHKYNPLTRKLFSFVYIHTLDLISCALYFRSYFVKGN